MNLDNSRILIIGGAGFVGSHIIDKLTNESVKEIVVLDNFIRGTRHNLEQAQKDNRVKVVEGSITDLKLLSEVMENIDYVFHLAALWLYECVHQPRSALEVNIDGTYNVVETAQKAGVKKVIFSSSASVYGDAVSIPILKNSSVALIFRARILARATSSTWIKS